jgi:hypothetical protein
MEDTVAASSSLSCLLRSKNMLWGTSCLKEIPGVHCAGLSDFSVRGVESGAALSQKVPTVK